MPRTLDHRDLENQIHDARHAAKLINELVYTEFETNDQTYRVSRQNAELLMFAAQIVVEKANTLYDRFVEVHEANRGVSS